MHKQQGKKKKKQKERKKKKEKNENPLQTSTFTPSIVFLFRFISCLLKSLHLHTILGCRYE